MHIGLVSCGSIPRLTISFRSKRIILSLTHTRLCGLFVVAVSVDSYCRLKNEVYMHMWHESCESILD